MPKSWRKGIRRDHRRLAVALLTAFTLISCRGGDTPLPRRIVDLSPPLTPDLDLRRLGSRALHFLGTEGRILVSPIVPSRTEFTYGIGTVTLLSHSGSH